LCTVFIISSFSLSATIASLKVAVIVNVSDADKRLSVSVLVRVTVGEVWATPTITISNSQNTPVDQREMYSAGYGFGGDTDYD
jgi:hypothetical protein